MLVLRYTTFGSVYVTFLIKYRNMFEFVYIVLVLFTIWKMRKKHVRLFTFYFFFFYFWLLFERKIEKYAVLDAYKLVNI